MQPVQNKNELPHVAVSMNLRQTRTTRVMDKTQMSAEVELFFFFLLRGPPFL